MKIDKLLISLIVVLMATGFSACSKHKNKDNTIAIDVNCIDDATAADIDTYITTIAGDSIVRDETNTTISMFVDATNVKKVCLVSGKAHIER